jgi:hypothetical protein
MGFTNTLTLEITQEFTEVLVDPPASEPGGETLESISINDLETISIGDLENLPRT